MYIHLSILSQLTHLMMDPRRSIYKTGAGYHADGGDRGCRVKGLGPWTIEPT